jgi:predicted AAA+ superfamily ATPase
MRYVVPSVEETLVSERKMVFVAGPRQVGKTTFARALLRHPDADYFNWDIDSHRRRSARWTS